MKKTVIAYVHTHWDREWYREFEVFRLRLLKVFDNVLDMLSENKIPSFYFDGQVIALLDYLELLKNKGIKIIVYLSYSSLGKEYEPNINHENIKLNFKNLASRGIQIIHYYRPFVIDNSNAKQIESTLDFVKNYTNISVVAGLKIRSDFIDKIDFLDIVKNKREGKSIYGK